MLPEENVALPRRAARLAVWLVPALAALEVVVALAQASRAAPGAASPPPASQLEAERPVAR